MLTGALPDPDRSVDPDEDDLRSALEELRAQLDDALEHLDGVIGRRGADEVDDGSPEDGGGRDDTDPRAP